jgi:hypothetical protein
VARPGGQLPRFFPRLLSGGEAVLELDVTPDRKKVKPELRIVLSRVWWRAWM